MKIVHDKFVLEAEWIDGTTKNFRFQKSLPKAVRCYFETFQAFSYVNYKYSTAIDVSLYSLLFLIIKML